jgi:hypothetical protein
VKNYRPYIGFSICKFNSFLHKKEQKECHP